MQVVKDNLAFKSPRERTLLFFTRGDLYFSRDLHISFVCGAADTKEGELPKLRTQFLAWAVQNEPKLICVRAERAVTDLLLDADERSKASNLGVIEHVIADTVDSLLLFPESPGSFAELGLFSANSDISKKMFVPLLAEHQGDSFITLGPIRQIVTRSIFAPFTVLAAPLQERFREIADRLLGEIRHERARRRRYSHKQWKEYSRREQLAILDCIFDLVGICTEEDLFDLISQRFGAYEKSDVRLLVSMLVALGRVKRTDEADVIRVVTSAGAGLIEGGDDEATEIKAKWNEAFRAHLPEARVEFEQANI